MDSKPLKIANHTINPGDKLDIELVTASLYSQSPINIPIKIIHGTKQGPCLFIMAAMHGDEINGVEIIRRLFSYSKIKKLHGTLIAIPVVNVQGFITLSRYMPDRRDLNRSFPGSKTGSLTARIAHLLMKEIISKCSHGIDLHTGNTHSENLPHLRTHTKVPGALAMAKAFNTPVILDAAIPYGSLRKAAAKLKIPVLTYEGGEALRFNKLAIRMGLRGALNVLEHLKMIPKEKIEKKYIIKSKVSGASFWVRSPKSGIFYQNRYLGDNVETGEKLGFIADPFSKAELEIFSTTDGIIIGRNTLPLVNEGDPLFHIARMKGMSNVTDRIQELEQFFNHNPFEFI